MSKQIMLVDAHVHTSCQEYIVNKSTRQRLLFLGRLALGVALLTALLVLNDNGRKVLDAFVQVQPIYLIPLFAITYPLLGASCMKWGLFLRERGVVIGFHRLFRLYLIGSFFNNFLPSMVGGDLVRAYVLGKQIESHAHSLASVFLERFTGMIALVSLATASFLFNSGLRQEPVVVGLDRGHGQRLPLAGGGGLEPGVGTAVPAAHGKEPPRGVAPSQAHAVPRPCELFQGQGSSSPSDIRINELGEGLSSNMTILSEGLSG
jgi:hypothetical protein